ncbi:hypothetical protein BURKHO8Y_10150 [Burkholderia sp. 8Y]|nr:hypothetical protein BURKHO8Y_10150 [Burkholderia sp. 8Y]
MTGVTRLRLGGRVIRADTLSKTHSQIAANPSHLADANARADWHETVPSYERSGPAQFPISLVKAARADDGTLRAIASKRLP